VMQVTEALQSVERLKLGLKKSKENVENGCKYFYY